MPSQGAAVLVLGASGFIGARVARQAAIAGLDVRAGARHPDSAQRRLPQFRWVKADFEELTEPAAWLPLLQGVAAVVNCVGVLQDAAGDSSEIAHVTAPQALLAACEQSGVRRFVHISAIGADEGVETRYARDKAKTEQMLAASGLEWVVIRPSLVVAREVYGGTALIRGLAGLPGLIPLTGAQSAFRPIHIEDMASLVVRCLGPDAPVRQVVEAAGPQTVSMEQLVLAYRTWLGFGPARTLDLPLWASWPMVKLGDLAGWLGWTSPLRTTSIRQLLHGAAGEAPPAPGARPFEEALNSEPAAVQDRWHARLYFVRPVSVVVLGLYWLLSGVIALGPGREAAVATLAQAGFGRWSAAANTVAAWLDLTLALLFFMRRYTRAATWGMLAMSGGYLIAASATLGSLWADPLGPLLKVLPAMALCLVVLATDDRR
jgi:uncharacterized protein YbjT (DUF2867 family)